MCIYQQGDTKMNNQEIYSSQIKSQNDNAIQVYKDSQKPKLSRVEIINSSIKNVISRVYPITYITTGGSLKKIEATSSVNLSYVTGCVSMLSDFENWTEGRIFATSEVYGGESINCNIKVIKEIANES